jgi:hypothetical protein
MDDQLREALGRRQAPDGFAERVMERVGRESTAKVVEWPSQPRARKLWRSIAAIAACFAVLVTGGLVERQRAERDRERAEAAQVFAALQLTAGKLHAVRARIVNANFSRKADPPATIQ